MHNNNNNIPNLWIFDWNGSNEDRSIFFSILFSTIFLGLTCIPISNENLIKKKVLLHVCKEVYYCHEYNTAMINIILP